MEAWRQSDDILQMLEEKEGWIGIVYPEKLLFRNEGETLTLCSVKEARHKKSCIYIIPFLWMGFPGGTSGKEPACQCRRHKRWKFHLWVGKISWGGGGMAIHSRILTWRVPWTHEPCGLPHSQTLLKWLSMHIWSIWNRHICRDKMLVSREWAWNRY